MPAPTHTLSVPVTLSPAAQPEYPFLKRPIELEQIDWRVARLVLHQAGEGGKPGDLGRILGSTVDELLMGYPASIHQGGNFMVTRGLIAAIRAYKELPDGVAVLQLAARKPKKSKKDRGSPR